MDPAKTSMVQRQVFLVLTITQCKGIVQCGQPPSVVLAYHSRASAAARTLLRLPQVVQVCGGSGGGCGGGGERAFWVRSVEPVSRLDRLRLRGRDDGGTRSCC